MQTETLETKANKTHDPAAAFRKPHGYVDTPNGRLARWKIGHGPDVVLIHGWPLHAATFRRIVPTLARHFTLHLFDMPGTGHSLEWSGPHTLTGHAAAVRLAVDDLGLRRYALIAHDSGGAVARFVAAEDARVAALVLSGTEIPGHRPPLVREYAVAAKIPGMGAILRAAMRRPAIRHSSLGFAGCFRDPSYMDGEFGDLFVRPLLESKRVFAGQMRLLRDLDWSLVDRLADAHTKIRAPVRCIWGSEDPFFPVQKARAMLSQFAGGAELVEVTGAKAFLHEDHPEQFVEHAGGFLLHHASA